jgi:cupin 2 domain-containing protein
MSPRNLLADLPLRLTEEQFDPLLATPDLRIERIVSLGQASAPGSFYDQDWDEWVLVIEGAAKLRFEGAAEPLLLRRGDCLEIPAHARHRVEWTDPQQPTVWLAIHYRARS